MTNATVFTDETIAQVSSRRRDDKPRERQTKDPITEAVSCTFYVLDKRFDFLRVPYMDRAGRETGYGEKFVFKRFYPEKNIIIDLINVDTDKVRKLTTQKCDAILAYNATVPEEKRLGYLPLLATQRVPKATFEKVAAHKVLNLPPRSEALVNAMSEKGIYIQH